MQNQEIFSKKANQDCVELTAKFYNGSFHIEMVDQEMEWDPDLKRLISDHQMIVWKKSGNFKVILNKLDQPVGFIDPEKWNECTWESMQFAEIMFLIRNESLEIHKALEISETRRGKNGCLEVVLFDKRNKSDRFIAEINPARKQIISIVPLDYYD